MEAVINDKINRSLKINPIIGTGFWHNEFLNQGLMVDFKRSKSELTAPFKIRAIRKGYWYSCFKDGVPEMGDIRLFLNLNGALKPYNIVFSTMS
jgi:hypothetical protein